MERVNGATAIFPKDESERIAALVTLAPDAKPDADIDLITLLAADRFNAPIALVSLVDTDRQWCKSSAGLAVPETSRAASFCVHAIMADAVFVVADTHTDDRFRNNPLVVGAPHVRFYAGAALTTTSGHRIGTLCVLDTHPRADFLERDCRALVMMASQVVRHLELQQLRRSDHTLHLIDATTTDAFVCADVDNRIIHWNRRAEAMFGWAANEALGKPLSQVIPHWNRTELDNCIGKQQAKMRSNFVGKAVEVSATTRAGLELPVELWPVSWTNEACGSVGGFAAIMRDVSERKALEAERDLVTQRLSEQLAAIDASNDGIAITDADGIFTFMNDAHAAMFGLGSGADGCGLSWRSLYSSDEIERLELVAFPRLNSERSWRGRATGTRRDGSKVEQETSLSLHIGGGIVCVTRDIGLQLAAERDQLLLREQLLVMQRQEALGQIAAGIAHDFNNCIAAISGSAAMILDQGTGSAHPHAERIAAASTSAGSLVKKMLTLGSRARSRERLDLRKVVGDVGELVRAGLTSSQRLHIDLPPDPLITYGDATELMQIILNLGVNARDALGGAPGRIVIELSLATPEYDDTRLVIGSRPKQATALIRVSDNGSGIPASAIPSIFEPYYTNKKGFGSGLGLAIVARLVTAADGGIGLSTRMSKGTVFDILWPLDQRTQRRTLSKASQPAATSCSLKGVGILIADDDPHVVATLMSVLEAAGAEVGPCQRPRDALAALRSDPDFWSLLITDFNMPGMTGASLSAAARRIRPDLPVLLCTAMPDAARTHRELFTAILAKPVDNKHLVETAAWALTMAKA